VRRGEDAPTCSEAAIAANAGAIVGWLKSPFQLRAVGGAGIGKGERVWFGPEFGGVGLVAFWLRCWCDRGAHRDYRHRILRRGCSSRLGRNWRCVSGAFENGRARVLFEELPNILARYSSATYRQLTLNYETRWKSLSPRYDGGAEGLVISHGMCSPTSVRWRRKFGSI